MSENNIAFTNSIGLRKAKANFSKLIKKVKQGSEIILTDRGKPVARLAPISNEHLTIEQRLTKLEEAGYLEPIKNKNYKLSAPLPLPLEKAQEFLQEDRGI